MKKKCSKCKRILDRTEFNKRKKSKDGLQYQCKECVSKYHKEKRMSLKREAINAFGSRCVHIDKNGIRCSKNSIDNLKDLDLMHPNNDGDIHRDLISNGLTGQPFYEALQKLGYDTGKFDVKVMCKFHHKSLDRSGKKHPLYKEGKFNDKDWLYHEYVILEKSIRKIAKECGTSYNLIRCRMIKFNIERRKPGVHP